jgi:hypothetical protein
MKKASDKKLERLRVSLTLTRISFINLKDIPFDIWTNICKYVDYPLLLKLSQTCKRFNQIFSDNAIWTPKCVAEGLATRHVMWAPMMLKTRFRTYMSLRIHWMTAPYVSCSSDTYGQSGGVSSLCVLKNEILSGSWDGQLALWKLQYSNDIKPESAIDPQWFDIRESRGNYFTPPTSPCDNNTEFLTLNAKRTQLLQKQGLC